MNDDLERTILDLAVEDSYSLPEVISRVRNTRSGLSARAAKEITRRTLEQMLDKGLITVTRLEKPEGDEQDLDYQKAKVALADDLSWVDLQGWRAHPRIAATEVGKKAYYGED